MFRNDWNNKNRSPWIGRVAAPSMKMLILRDFHDPISADLVSSKTFRTSTEDLFSKIRLDSKAAIRNSCSSRLCDRFASLMIFLDRALQKMFLGGLFSVIALGIFGGLLLMWISLPIEKLRQYAIGVAEGGRPELPVSNVKEVKHLGEAFEKMRISLEGKKTIEKYTQTLTHEMKSP
ncbi:MAG: HAMP domain-containing protein, partial [Proteobacteria bacterium]